MCLKSGIVPAAALVFALSAVLAATPLAQDAKPDTQISEDVVRSVRTYPRFTVFDDVSVEVQQGVLTLAGRVTLPFKKEEIGRRAAAIDGVKSVRNEIGVLPASPYDDELRHKVARAIYGNSAFWRYAAMPNPPIHIIVEAGRVTLTGVVTSEVERTLARSLASGLGEVSLTNALRTDAQARF
jgi:hyperosmotically inducible protein